MTSNWNDAIIEEFRENGGTVETAGFGRSLVLVHHTGAKSGIERVTPLMALRQGDDSWLIAASKAGAPENPAWYHNLLAHPEAVIETPDDGVVPVTATRLTGADRDDAWKLFTDHSDGFAQYQERTARTIPVLRLTRRAR